MNRLFAILALGVVLLLSSSAFAQKNSLEDAYKKEFAFLKAQKQALLRRLGVIHRNTRLKLGRTQAELKGMQRKLFGLRDAATRLSDALREANRLSSNVQDAQAQYDKTLERAKYALKKAGFKPPKVQGKDKHRKQLQTIFAKGMVMLKNASSVRRKPGRFFLKDGSEVKGTILHIGKIAAYGFSSRGSGALAPAGSNKLKLWPQSADATIAAFKSNQRPGMLQIFLFEKLNKPINAKKEKTFSEWLKAGGVIAEVIAALGLLSMLLVVLRFLLLFWNSLGSGRLVNRLVKLLKAGRREEAMEVAEKGHGSMGRVLSQTLTFLHLEREQLEDQVSESLLEETPRIERFGTAIMVIAAVAPLLGLLGTVTGMISTFSVITEHGTGDPKMLAGGISEALITTQLGLIVSIPALLLGTLLKSQAEALLGRLEWAALHVINLSRIGQEYVSEEEISVDDMPVLSHQPTFVAREVVQ
jgi:biopolymer transport protein ExbB